MMKHENTQQYIKHTSVNGRHSFFAVLLVAGMFVLQACGGGAANNENTGNNPNNNNNGGGGTQGYTGPAPASNDVQLFRINVWENIRGTNRCGQCHDVGGQGGNAFANNADVNAAYTAALTVVNPTDIPSSQMITKFSGAGHFCWESTQSACAAQLQIWIENWLSSSDSGGRTIVLTPPADENPAPSISLPDTVPPEYYTGGSFVDPDTGMTVNVPTNETVYGLVSRFCVDCHRPDGPVRQQSPFFAILTPQPPDSPEQLSYNNARSVPLINTTTAALSRFYTRIAGGHQCWDSPNGNNADLCVDSSQDMLRAIKYLLVNGAQGTGASELGDMITSKAVSLFEDGIVASGGNRYEASQVALYEFKLNGGDTAIDSSGVSPSANLTLFGTEGVDYEWLASWGIRFNTANAKAQAMPSDSDKLYQTITATGEYSIEAWVIPGNVNQEDTTIIGYSRNPTDRNFMLSQTLYSYDAYNRNTNALTDAAGEPLLQTADEDAQAVLQHVVVTYDPVNGRRIYVNGNFTDDMDPIPGDSLSNWSTGAALVLGNEVDLSRPWSGTIRLLAIHNRALSEAQIRQNFDVGVGQKFYLLFDISEHLGPECRGPDPDLTVDDPARNPDYDPKCFIYMEAAQFDNNSFLFAYPRFITLDNTIDPTGIRIRGMRIGINGREASNGQGFASMNEVIGVTGTYDPNNGGQLLSSIGTIVALEKGPAPQTPLTPDMIFLSFEELDGKLPVKDYTENYPTTPEPMDPDVKSAVMIHNFEEINASMAAMTNVPRTLEAIGGNSNINPSDSNGTYTDVVQALPGTSEVDTFVPSQQMAITQLAIEYCNALVDGSGSTAPGSYFNGGLTFSATSPTLNFSNATERDYIITPLLERVFNVDGATELLTMPAASDLRNYLTWLMHGNGGTITGLDAVAECGGGTGTCTAARTKTIIKSTCAAAIASAPMLLQ